MKYKHTHYCLECHKRYTCYKGSMFCRKVFRYCNDCLVLIANYGMSLKTRKG